MTTNGNQNGNGWIIYDTDRLMQAITAETRKAIRRHKLLGNPICVGDPDGTVRWIQPEDIELEDD